MIPVQFNGLTLWCEPETLEVGNDGALAPPEHVTNGELNGRAFSGDSYAHVIENGEIKRYMTVIGHRSDLVPLCSSCHTPLADRGDGDECPGCVEKARGE